MSTAQGTPRRRRGLATAAIAVIALGAGLLASNSALAEGGGETAQPDQVSVDGRTLMPLNEPHIDESDVEPSGTVRRLQNTATKGCLHGAHPPSGRHSGDVKTKQNCSTSSDYQKWYHYKDGYGYQYKNVATGQCLATQSDGAVFTLQCGVYKNSYWQALNGDITRLQSTLTGNCMHGSHANSTGNGHVKTKKCSSSSDYHRWIRHAG